MAEWLKALVSKTGIPFTGYRGFESPFFRKRGNGTAVFAAVLFFCRRPTTSLNLRAFPEGYGRFGHYLRDFPEGCGGGGGGGAKAPP